MNTNQIPYHLRIADDADIKEIHKATVEILTTQGAVFRNEDARNILFSAGCTELDTGRIAIPEEVITRCIASAPKTIRLYSREGDLALNLEENYVYCGTGSDCPYVLDAKTGERRKAIKQDIAQFARLSDALSNIDFVLSMGIASDIPTAIADLHHFQAMVYNTTKPIFFTVVNPEIMPLILEIAAEIVEGMNNLKKKPFIAHFAMPTPPLSHSTGALANLIFCAKQSIPVVYASGTQIGTSGPMSIAGSTVSSNIDVLAGLVVHQLAKPGAPFIYGVCVAPFDMKTAVEAYGAPEHYPGDALNVQIAKYYGLPTWGYGADTDSKIVDLQAAMEYMGSTLFGMLSRCNLLHDVGYLESGMTASCESIVFANEVIEFCRRMLKPVTCDKDALAMDSIKATGSNQTFLTDQYTLKHVRDFWYSPLIDRELYVTWDKKGRLSMLDRIRQKTKILLETHHPIPINPEIIKKIEKIMAEQDRKS